MTVTTPEPLWSANPGNENGAPIDDERLQEINQWLTDQGMEPEIVAEVAVYRTPKGRLSARAVVYNLDEHGRKHLSMGEPCRSVRSYPLSSLPPGVTT